MIKRMLLREVEYARPGSIDEAVRLLGAHDGARALAGGQTLVNVMKARAAAPEVLVDLADLAELRAHRRSRPTARRSSSARWSPTASSSARPRSPPHDRSWPRSQRTIADLQVQNRGTVGGNVCVNDPTNHFPPLLAALGATFTILGADGERTVAGRRVLRRRLLTAVGEGELLTRITRARSRRPAPATRWRASRSGVHGTYIVSAAATVGPGDVRVAIGCVSGVPERATTLEEPSAAAPS